MVWLILLVATVTASATSQRCLSDGRVECECKHYNPYQFKMMHLHNADDSWDNEVFDPECSEPFTCHSVESLYHFPAPAVNTEAAMVAMGYERHVDSLYKFHTAAMTWENARRKCEEEGAHLAIVNSASEAEVLRQMLNEHPELPSAYEQSYAYIGYHDIINEGEYLTIFGEPIDSAGYSVWERENPDNSGWDDDGNPGEDCGSINRDGKLNDLNCGYLNAFICEREDSLTTVRDGINYSANAYKALEKLIKPTPGTRRRTDPGVGYEYFPGVGSYRLHTKTDVWENARRTCEKEGAHLAIVNSYDEAQVLKEMLRRQPRIQDVSWDMAALVGIHDQYNEGQFLTIYGDSLESTGYLRWYHPVEPNNVGGTDTYSGQDCGGFHRDGGLDDLDCNKKYAFFCEKELFY